MSIDRADAHEEDAGSLERAARHIALFLWWAAERGLADEQHDPQAIAGGPAQYLVDECDTKLWPEDLTSDGVAFASAEYDAYLGEVSEYASTLGIGDYEVPENETTRAHFFAWLDGKLAAWRRGRAN